MNAMIADATEPYVRRGLPAAEVPLPLIRLRSEPHHPTTSY